MTKLVEALMFDIVIHMISIHQHLLITPKIFL